MGIEKKEVALRAAREDVERLQRLATHLDYLARGASKKIDEIESADESQVAMAMLGFVSVGYCIVMSVGECEEYSRETRAKHG